MNNMKSLIFIPLVLLLAAPCIAMNQTQSAWLEGVHFGMTFGHALEAATVLSILWGWQIDKVAPDKFDLLGGLVALIGVVIIMYWPRG